MITDAHTHWKKIDGKDGKERLAALKAQDLRLLVSASGPEECAALSVLARQAEEEGAAERLLFSFGIHPWDSQRFDADSIKPGGKMEPYLRSCPVIGEIGMDRVWCTVPMEIQRERFLAQLDLAVRRGCPVVLHTKGCETEIAEILEGYSESELRSILVHWYSGGEEALERFLRRGCYFSVGPDVSRNPDVLRVVRRVPAFRLLVETDGTEGVEWALGRKAGQNETAAVLRESAALIGKEKGMSLSAVLSLLEKNFQHFL